MADGYVDQVAEAIGTALTNATHFSQTINVIVSDSPEVDVKTLPADEYRVLVVPLDEESRRVARGVREHRLMVGITLVKKVDDPKKFAQTKAPKRLVEEIDDFLAFPGRKMADAHYLERNVGAFLSKDSLENRHRFANASTFVYRLERLTVDTAA